jgi:ankyrin repeat protein
VFERIRTQFAEEISIVRRIFFWLVHSLRPLKAAELADALGYVADEDRFDFTAVPTDPEDLLLYCGGLVSLSDADGTIGLAHFSIKEFLLSERIRKSSVHEFYADHELVHADIVTTCISYLSINDFTTGPCYTVRQWSSRLDSQGLMKYAALYWMKHYKRINPTLAGGVDLRIFEFLTESRTSGNVLAWQQIEERASWLELRLHIPRDERGRSGRPEVNDPDVLSPIYHAAHYGLWGVTQLLLEAGYDVNAPGGKYKYPTLAAAFGHFRDWPYVSKLIAAGADIHVKSGMGNIAYANARFGTPEDWWLLKDLVAAGVDLNVRVSHDQYLTILQAVSIHPSDSADMVKFLLEHGADANEMDSFPEQDPETHQTKGQLPYGPPLQQAARQGNLKVAQVLLDHGARIDFARCKNGSPLQAATEGGHAMMVQFLLGKGANVNTKGGDFGSPLQAAAHTGNKVLVELFIGIDANVNADGGFRGSPLAEAMAQKHFEIVNTLLQNHANPNGGTPNHATPLLIRDGLSLQSRRKKPPVNWAIYHAKLPVINQLIDAGADLNIPNGRCNATNHNPSASHPLCVAIQIANHTIIDLLLSRGVIITNGQCCALSTAAKGNEFSLFKRLYGEIPSPYDPKSVFLEAFSLNSDENFTRNLIELMRSSSIHFSADVCGWLLSGHHQSPAKMEFLLKNDANPNTVVVGSQTITRNVTIYGHSTPLIKAIEGRRTQGVDLLLDHGADVNLVNPGKICGSPLFAAMKIGNVGLFRRLLELGAQPNKSIWVYNGVNVCCWNLLHHAAAESNLEMVNLLLEYGADLHARCDICPTALWRAAQAEDCQMIKFLVQRGADVNELDLYGQKILRRAQQDHLDDACKLLSELGAQSDPPSQRDARESTESAVKLFSKELSKRHATEDWPWELLYFRWMMLARCFYLANDVGNAMIALEQVFRDSYVFEDEFEDEIFHHLPCSMCRSTQRGKYHVCKDGDGFGICEDCIGKHERKLKAAGTLDTHEFLTYPRPFFSTIPKGFVALSETEFIPREDWLENIGANWSFDSVEAQSC